MHSKKSSLVIKIPDRVATPYRKLSMGFELMFKITDCDVIKMKPIRKVRPPPIETRKTSNAANKNFLKLPFELISPMTVRSSFFRSPAKLSALMSDIDPYMGIGPNDFPMKRKSKLRKAISEERLPMQRKVSDIEILLKDLN
jgi:hypothetical protein